MRVTVDAASGCDLPRNARIVEKRRRKFREVVSRFNGLAAVAADTFSHVLFHTGVYLMARRPPTIVVLAATLAVGLCRVAFAQDFPAPLPPPAVAPAGSLYERLGGTAKVSAFVGVTIERTAADPALNRTFDKVNLQHVKDMLVLQICSLTGGGCTYTGDTMRDVHAGHKITNAEFAGLVEVLRDAMRAQSVPLPARNELLAMLAPMKRDVVKL